MNWVQSLPCQLCSPPLSRSDLWESFPTRIFSRTIFLLASCHHTVHSHGHPHFLNRSESRWKLMQMKCSEILRTFGLCYSRTTVNKRDRVFVWFLSHRHCMCFCACLALRARGWKERGGRRKQEKKVRGVGLVMKRRREKKREGSWELPFPPDRSLH